MIYIYIYIYMSQSKRLGPKSHEARKAQCLPSLHKALNHSAYRNPGEVGLLDGGHLRIGLPEAAIEAQNVIRERCASAPDMRPPPNT